jgi:hypothetical protein
VGAAIGAVLPLAVGVAISPIPIIAMVLMLDTPRAHTTGPAFGLGWVCGLAVVGVLMLLLAGDDAQKSGGPATWVSWLRLVLGLLFLLLAVRSWRGRPVEGEAAEMAKWMRAIDTFTAGRSLATGGLLAGVNPKNLALTIAASVAIAQTAIPGAQQAVALAVFVLLGSLTIMTPIAVYFLMGARAAAILENLKAWLSRHHAVIMTVLLLVLGAKLVGDAISGIGS